MADVSFYNPAQELEVKRRRRMAEALMKRGEQPTGTEVVSGVAVRQSPLAALARAIQGGMGEYEDRQADQMDANILSNRQKMMADAISKVGSDPNAAASMLAQDPNTASSGMQIALEMMKDKKAMELAQFKAANGGDGAVPAPIKLANEIQSAIKSGDYDRANLLAQSAKMFDRGVNPYGPGGVAPMDNYGDAVSSIQKMIEAAKEQAKKNVDLDMNPQIAGKEKTAELNATKLDALESSDAALNEFDASKERFNQVLKETPNSKMGPIAGRYARFTADEQRTNLDSAMNEMTLRAKGLLGMPSANFSDADRDFLTDISGGKYAEHGGYEKVVQRMSKMASDQRSINDARRANISGQSYMPTPPPLPNQQPVGAPPKVDYKSKYGLQ